MTKHFRAPLFDAFRTKNPFEGLWSHSAKVTECLAALETTLDAFLTGQPVDELAQTVSSLEFEADQIKSNVRNHLPGFVRMPVDKSLFLQALSEQDGILDAAEDAAIWMTMKPFTGTDEVKEGLKTLLTKVVETGAAYQAAVENMKDVLETGFVSRERAEEKELIHRVHELEHETDVLGRSLSKELFAAEATLGATGVFHLLKLANMIGSIADSAENAGDRLRAMMAR
ncbi:MAG: TIGR00153 family protein [Thermoplasmatota archaeon]